MFECAHNGRDSTICTVAGPSSGRSLAETINGHYETEVVQYPGPWKGREDVEYATLEWVAWYTSQRLMEPLGYLPPAEYGEPYHWSRAEDPAPALNQPSLRKTRGGSTTSTTEASPAA